MTVKEFEKRLKKAMPALDREFHGEVMWTLVAATPKSRTDAADVPDILFWACSNNDDRDVVEFMLVRALKELRDSSSAKPSLNKEPES